MIFTPLDADIGGAPPCWLKGSRLVPASLQPTGSPRTTIPFDRCTAVVEYDALSGVLPSADGWVTAPGAANDGVWALSNGSLSLTKTVQEGFNGISKTAPYLVTGSSVLYGYCSMSGDIPLGSSGDGLVFRPLANLTAAASGTTFGQTGGSEVDFHGGYIWYRQLGDKTGNPGAATNIKGSTNIPLSSGWVHAGAAIAPAGAYPVSYIGTDLETRAAQLGAWETVGQALTWVPYNFNSLLADGGASPTILANTLEVQLGSGPHSSYTGYFRDAVAADGRWIRARFAGYTQVTAPTMRLYLTAETNASAAKSARFLVKYGPTSNPNTVPSLSVGTTVSLSAANMTYEVPLNLPGLAANAPFWFSIERDWEHADDLLDATVHLLHGTVRAR